MPAPGRTDHIWLANVPDRLRRRLQRSILRCIGAIHRRRGTKCGEEAIMLELAILGILHESPMHGYELRKQLATKVGAFRAAISYGSLYPTLRRLQAEGCLPHGQIAADTSAVSTELPPMTNRRRRY